MSLQIPTERVLGRRYKRTSSGSMIEVRDCCYDIPLLDSLQSLLKCESIVTQVLDAYACRAICSICMHVYAYGYADIQFTPT